MVSISTNKSTNRDDNRNPLDILAKAHIDQIRLCNILEEIADGLPGSIDRSLCAQASGYLENNLIEHHRQEENGLFLVLEERLNADHDLPEILERLREEHATDEGFASEIAEKLTQLANGSTLQNPDMLGYMLRGFFEIYRRHIHWEDTILMPLAREHLDAADLVRVAERFSQMSCAKS
jgi:hemerythrin-like domain-containing protein